jgi:hypothetical protein
MHFTPLSDDEIKYMGMIEPGIYDFDVVAALDEISKTSGQEQIKLTLLVFENSGKEHTLFDYLTTHPSMRFKVKHFCEVAGILNQYDAGDLAASDCINKSGKVEIQMQKGKPNPKGGNYPDRPNVKDYVVNGTATNKKSFEDDSGDIPF